MKKLSSIKTGSTLAAALVTSTLLMNPVYSADHQEAPSATALLSADIGDYYAWHDDNMLNLVLTFGTFASAEMPATFDGNILYEFHFDTQNVGDGVSELDLYARFAQDVDGNWGVQVFGTDDVSVQGPVETNITSGGVTAWAGLADDPFFFDATGFRETVSTGTLAFNPERDDVAGLNVTAIAIQLPFNLIQSEGTALQTWATTSTL